MYFSGTLGEKKRTTRTVKSQEAMAFPTPGTSIGGGEQKGTRNGKVLCRNEENFDIQKLKRGDTNGGNQRCAALDVEKLCIAKKAENGASFHVSQNHDAPHKKNYYSCLAIFC
jgi:hypothetical protein